MESQALSKIVELCNAEVAQRSTTLIGRVGLACRSADRAAAYVPSVGGMLYFPRSSLAAIRFSSFEMSRERAKWVKTISISSSSVSSRIVNGHVRWFDGALI